MELENSNPNVFNKIADRTVTTNEEDDDVVDEFDTREIFGKFQEHALKFTTMELLTTTTE